MCKVTQMSGIWWSCASFFFSSSDFASLYAFFAPFWGWRNHVKMFEIRSLYLGRNVLVLTNIGEVVKEWHDFYIVFLKHRRRWANILCQFNTVHYLKINKIHDMSIIWQSFQFLKSLLPMYCLVQKSSLIPFLNISLVS